MNNKKRLAKLRYKDDILKLHKQGISVREIAKQINKRLKKTKLNTTLSYTTIYNVIKTYKDKNV